MARTAQISKEKQQSIVTLRGSVNLENVKDFESSEAKTIKRYDETGSDKDHHRKGRPRVTSAAEDMFL